MSLDEGIALGFRAHSGWAVVVAVARARGKFVVLERRRIVTADGARQPYHAAEKLDFGEAAAYLEACRERSTALATDAVAAMLAQRPAVCAAIVTASGRALPELAGILRSHPLIHTAEGEFFREVLAVACERCGVRVVRIREREVAERATAALRCDPVEMIRELGREIGPPWTQDEKLAALAAWVALAEG